MHVLVIAALAAGLADRGIFPELDPLVSIAAPERVAAPWLRIDRVHRVETLYDGDDPVKAYPLPLRRDDTAEIQRLAPGARVVEAAPARGEDRDGDGIVDRLDVLLGGKKLLHNGARYIERY